MSGYIDSSPIFSIRNQLIKLEKHGKIMLEL